MHWLYFSNYSSLGVLFLVYEFGLVYKVFLFVPFLPERLLFRKFSKGFSIYTCLEKTKRELIGNELMKDCFWMFDLNLPRIPFFHFFFSILRDSVSLNPSFSLTSVDSSGFKSYC